MEKKATTMLTALAAMVTLMMTARDLCESAKEEKEEIHKTLRFSAEVKSRHLEIDNIFGSISVRGYDGKEVVADIRKTIRADSESEAEKARREVTIKIEEGGDKVELYVDGPFREKNKNHSHDIDYIVQYDFDMRIPYDTELTVKTVNNGHVTITGQRGDFHLSNVNGSITAEGITGSGEAHTVNGRVKVVFNRNPANKCSFRTINGNLETVFSKNLSADFWLKTFNGSIYSDFPAISLPQPAATTRREGERFVYKSSRFGGIRIGKGGPEITMDTLNGDILIASQENK